MHGDAGDQSATSGALTNIIDDEIAGWLRQAGERMRADGKIDGSIVMSFDSCFSGTLSRGDLVERGRAWDEDLDGTAPAKVRGNGSAEVGSILDLPPRDYTLLSATRSDQTAKERDGMGVYSWALIAALNELPRDISYKER